MVLTLSQVALTLLLATCFMSFSWAIRNFFVRPEYTTTGLRLTLIAGITFAALHLIVILRTPDMLPPAVAIAAFLYGAALVIFWWAVAANRVKPLAACFGKDEPLHLVQHGPYRFVRHPFYCAYLLTWMAGAVATLNGWLALTMVVMFALYLTAAIDEENKFAESSLATAYETYRRSTGRFFPKPLKMMAGRHLH